MLTYQPVTCVWEVTMGCNMRCGHCGSSCAEPLPDELTTDEALDLCRQIAKLGLKWVTLSGGEPLTRKDIHLLVKELHDNGVIVNIITNGWLLQEKMVDKLLDSGIATVAISIDGTREVHNSIRRPQAFEHAEKAFALLKAKGIKTGAVTTITNQNIDILGEIKEELIRIGVDTWQVQLGLPMGNLKERPDWLLEPRRVKEIIDFCYATAKEGRIKIFPADCIGYYTKKELAVKKISYGTDMVSVWDGCNAGIRGFGILHNGDILGCTSIRDRSFIEGNIRERLLKDIWEDENAFQWRRKLTKEQLSGDCKTCRYGSKCLGGCPNTRLTMNGDIHSENQYCAYNLRLKELKHKYDGETSVDMLLALAESMIRQGEYQEADCALARALELEPDNTQALEAKGYTDYMCGNYSLCLEDNQKAMELNQQDDYAVSGYAHALYKMGDKEKAVQFMEKAVSMGSANRQEYLGDLRVMMANR